LRVRCILPHTKFQGVSSRDVVLRGNGNGKAFKSRAGPAVEVCTWVWARKWTIHRARLRESERGPPSIRVCPSGDGLEHCGLVQVQVPANSVMDTTNVRGMKIMSGK
jgi:hypothetical protein